MSHDDSHSAHSAPAHDVSGACACSADTWKGLAALVALLILGAFLIFAISLDADGKTSIAMALALFVILSLIGLVFFLALALICRSRIVPPLLGFLAAFLAALILNFELPAAWNVPAMHSDIPDDALEAIENIDREIAVRKSQLSEAAFRSGRKAMSDKTFQPEPGETLDEALRAKMAERAPQWERVEARARELLDRHSARTPSPAGN